MVINKDNSDKDQALIFNANASTNALSRSETILMTMAIPTILIVRGTS